MKTKSKRTISSIILFLSSFIYFTLAYIGYAKQNIDLKNYDLLESVIIDKGIDYRRSSKGTRAPCFYILLEGHAKKLGVYRVSKDYRDLLKKFNVSDTVTAYYQDNDNRSENINIDLVQVERNGKVLLDKKEYERKESSLIYIGLIFGFGTVVLAYLDYKRKIFKDRS
jgi:hypothetical protein